MPGEVLREILSAELAAVGVDVGPRILDLCLRYLALLNRWRVRARLTAITDPRKAARLHLADSLLCLRADLPTGGLVIDVGSGAGLPGIPLAIARPDLSITLLEAESRKAAFLDLAVRELGVNGRSVCRRAEDAGHDPQLRERFDVVVARAVAPAGALLELCLPFAIRGGRCALLKGPGVRPELRRAAAAAAILGGGTPDLVEATLAGGERRVLIVVGKERATPDQYPRRTGAIRRHPLPINRSGPADAATKSRGR